MSQVEIVHLDSYRKRRDARYGCAVALYAHETERIQLLEELRKALGLVGGDRAGVVWVDEYGPGLAHPYLVLDLGADQPRRSFSPVPLRTAWDTRVPGLLDIPQTEGQWEQFGDGVASACVVAMGSDGPRSWFLVIDSLTPRQALSDPIAGDLMFLAGEIGSVVLHRGARTRLTPARGASRTPERSEEAEQPGFAGWPILKDLDEVENDEATSLRIRNRFLVTRVIRGVVDDDLVADSHSLAYQVHNVREELAADRIAGAEEDVWERVLESASVGDHPGLMAGLLEWGRIVDGQGHGNGALEILGLAFELAQAVGSASAGVDAARFKGKVYRSQARWDRALEWYDIAQRIAADAGENRKLPVVLDGMANTYRDLGNLPRAKELLDEVLAMGEEMDDSYTMAIAHHDLMTVERLLSNLVLAIQHGWKAVKLYESSDGMLRALFDLAGVLRESGEWSAARNAYSIVVSRIKVFEYRLLSLDALAYIAAVMGEEEACQGFRDRMDEEGWENLSPVYRGQVLYYRGLSSRALGKDEEAMTWLRASLAMAEEHKLNKLIFDAERELAWVREPEADSMTVPAWRPEPCGDALRSVRQGLVDLRNEALADAR